ncbi:MAG: prolyl oligopeptidase family serine peptidase [Planctomycetaceae bacterium]
MTPPRLPATLPVALLVALVAAAAAPADEAPFDAAWHRAGTHESRFGGLLFRQRIEPRWVEEGAVLVYRVRTGAYAEEVVRVDCRSGERRVLAADDPLARELGAAPARRLRLDRPLRGGNGPETSIRLENATDQPLRTVWIEAGERRRSYGDLAPGAARDQHTFAGHVWGYERADGTLLAAAAAEPGGSTFRIESLEPDVVPAGARERRGRRRPATPPPAAVPPAAEVVIRDGNLVARLPDGTEAPLTTDATPAERATDARFVSPDGRFLAAIWQRDGEHRTVRIVESAPADQPQPRLIEFRYDKPGDRIDERRVRLFDLEARAEIHVDGALCPTPWEISDFLWLPDSSEFLFRYNERGHRTMRVLAVAVPSGRVRTVVEETSPTFIDWVNRSWLHWLPAEGKLLWSSERSGWHHLEQVDIATGARLPITAGPWVLRGVDDVDERDRTLTIRLSGRDPAQSPYHVHHARVGFDGDGFTMLTEGDGTHELAWSPDGETYVDTFSRVDLPPRHELRRASDGALLCALEAADDAALLTAGWQRPERFVAKGRDGVTDIHGVILRPAGFDPARRYPVVENVYAGPQDSHAPVAWRTSYGSMSALAELGFVVVQADGMGTSNRSKAFHDVCHKNLGDAGFPDRIAWLRAAAATRPWMDLDRVGIYGGSAGGQNAMRALIAHSDVYSVAVADCGCHDNRMDKIWWNEQWMGWPLDASWDESSNVVQAHRLRGKLMLVVGEVDRNVDPASTMQAAAALVKACTDFELLVMPGVGHGACETPYASRRRAEFLWRHLRGE